MPKQTDPDKLLKQLQQVELQEKRDILPGREHFNLFLSALTFVFGLFLLIISVVFGQAQYLTPIPIIVMLISGTASFYLTSKNQSWAFYACCFVVLLSNAFITYADPVHYSELILLMDGFSIFVFANQFFKIGYLIGAVLIIFKMLYLYLNYPDARNGALFIASVVIVLVIGVIPVLIISLGKITRKSKINELRAEMLSMQNQELLATWGHILKPKGTDEPSIDQTAGSSTNIPANYTSPYN